MMKIIHARGAAIMRAICCRSKFELEAFIKTAYVVRFRRIKRLAIDSRLGCICALMFTWFAQSDRELPRANMIELRSCIFVQNSQTDFIKSW